jgi:UDP-2,4-diacetamido-2,4,6-trideoxy-beta-L-altropyranose hydrolase
LTGDIKAVAFRVDASAQIGTGHFMRCLTLAEGLKQRGARVRFVSRHSTEHFRALATAGAHEFVPICSPPEHEPATALSHAPWLGTSRAADARDTIQALSGQHWDWLVVDHYALDAQWERALRETAARILAIDDIADRDHDCDILLDQNLYHDADRRYAGKMPERCRTLLGPRYALLREVFGRLRAGIGARSGQVRRVLVFFGGMDTGAYTSDAIEALARLGRHDLQVDVVIGAQHVQRRNIEDRCAALGFACHVQTERMAELMAAADLAVGAGGSTSWERCCLGLPALALCVADNQKQLIEDAALACLLYAPAIRRDGSATMTDHLRSLLDNPLLLRTMSRNGMHAVDGRGTQRVLRAMGFGTVTVRRASGPDSARIFSWRNHPTVRAVSRNPDAIERSAHEAWFTAALANRNQLLLIGERDGDDVGVVRFDVRDGAAEISIYLAPELGGHGNGIELLLAAESWLMRNRPDVGSVEAEVLRDNRLSHGLFLAGGYQLASSRYVKRLA